MTQPSPAHAQSHTDSAALAALVEACRRRLVWSAFVRHSCVALAVASVLAAGAALAGVSVWWWSVAASAAALAVAALLAGFRAPTRRACAAAIDRRLALPDVVVAGVESRDCLDPVDALVVRAAAARVRGISPAQVFPLRLGAAARAGALVWAVVTAAVVLGLFSNTSDPVGRNGSMAGASIAAGAGVDAKASDPQADRHAQAAAPGQEPAMMVATEQDAAAPDRSEQASAPGPDEARTDRSPFEAGEGGAARVPDGTLAQNTGMPSTSGTASSSASREPRVPAATGQGSPDMANAGAAGRGAAAGASPSGATAAGGLSGGALAAPAPHEASPLRGGSYAARYRAARAQAEAAVRRDDVPPEYRSYVRRYFDAIAPGEPE